MTLKDNQDVFVLMYCFPEQGQQSPDESTPEMVRAENHKY